MKTKKLLPKEKQSRFGGSSEDYAAGVPHIRATPVLVLPHPTKKAPEGAFNFRIFSLSYTIPILQSIGILMKMNMQSFLFQKFKSLYIFA